MDNEEFLTVAEVAARLRTSKMTIYREISRGRLDAIRVGRSFRIKRSSVERLINAGQVEA